MCFSHGFFPAVWALLLIVGCRDVTTEPGGPATTPASGLASDTEAPLRLEDGSLTDAGNPSSTESPQEETGKGGPTADVESVPPEPFEPPFEDRVDLFAPPSRGANKTVVSDDRKETVELYGFVNVDGVRAILAIGDIVAPVAEGEERLGIQVIAIQPPQVVLQRDRQRWTARLEE